MNVKRCLAALLIAAAPAVAQVHDPRALDADPKTAEGPIAPELKGLGDHHFPVPRSSPWSGRSTGCRPGRAWGADEQGSGDRGDGHDAPEGGQRQGVGCE